MHHNLEASELYENFTLLPEEMVLLANKSGTNRIGFSVILKFFRLEGRFPENLREIPKASVEYIAEQLKLPSFLYKDYKLDSRHTRRHKDQIKKFLGFRSDSVEDANSIQSWFLSQTHCYDYTVKQMVGHLYQRYKYLKIEPPTPNRIERIANSILSTLEDQLFSTIFGECI